jgi:hypothetical protein
MSNMPSAPPGRLGAPESPGWCRRGIPSVDILKTELIIKSMNKREVCFHKSRKTITDPKTKTETNLCENCFAVFWIKSNNAGSENQPSISKNSCYKSRN